MRIVKLLLAILFNCFLMSLIAQTDSLPTKRLLYRQAQQASLAKLNTTANMMIGGGVGLCGAGAYLLYYGVSVYNSAPVATSTTPLDDINRNHRQGTAYLVTGSLAIAGCIALVALGAMRKHEFKVKKRLRVEAGVLPDGRLQAVLHF